MSWVSLGSANLVDGSTVRGYVYFEYDDTSGEPRSCRLRIAARSGYTFNVNFNNITVDGTNYGSKTGLTQNSGTFWTGTVSGGRSVTAKWTNPWYSGSKTPSITGSLPAGGTGPSGLYINSITSTYNSVSATVGLSSYGTASGSKTLELIVLEQTYVAGLPHRYSSATDGRLSYSTTVNNSSAASGAGGITIKGAGMYYTGVYAKNGTKESRLAGPSVYTPPAAPSISYSQTQGSTNVTVNLTITGANSSSNNGNNVSTSYRYSTNGDSTYSGWTTISGTATPWTAKTASFTCPYNANIKVQAKQTYQSKDSTYGEVSFTSTTGTAPSNYASSITASTWNSVTMNGSVNYGMPSSASGRALTVGVNINGSSLANRREKNTQNVASVSGVVINNSSSNLGGDFTLKGMLPVYPYAWASNTVQSGAAIGSVYYLPPAPGQLSYAFDNVDEYTVSYVGNTNNNISTYVAADLTRTVRYKIDNGAWVYIENDTVLPLTTVTSDAITVPSQSTITAEAWMTYKGKTSSVSTFTATNANLPVHLYGSVNGMSKRIEHFYGSVYDENTSTYKSKKIKKLYASVNGLSKKIFEDLS